MKRPTVEVADILRAQGKRFLDRYRSSFDFQQLKTFRAIQNCRTAALGGHLDACPQSGHQAISYNSCRNRHCPKCQARERELLPTHYFHVVFTVPHELNLLALDNPRVFYNLLFTASAATLLEVAADRKHLGAQIGILSILHTWGQPRAMLQALTTDSNHHITPTRPGLLGARSQKVNNGFLGLPVCEDQRNRRTLQPQGGKHA
jgi:hypothetical protein